MPLPSFVIVPAADREVYNNIWEVMGRGPGTFSVACCALDPGATYQTPATHYLMSDAGASAADVAVWQAMASTGTLPTPAPGQAWGGDFMCTQQEAQAVVGSGNAFRVLTCAGEDDSGVRAAWLLAQLEVFELQKVPDEPV